MFNRRDAILVGGSFILSGMTLHDLLAQDDKRIVEGGWIDLPEERRRFIQKNKAPYLSDLNAQIKGTSKGKAVVLQKAYEQVTRKVFQPWTQEIGDCIGEASTLGAEFLTATQIVYHKKAEEWRGHYSVEVTYAGSRVEAGGGRIRWRDGSYGAWAAEYLRDYGVVLRGVYGEHDLTRYRPDLGRKWGREGVPDELDEIAKEHPIKTTALVQSWEEAADSIANGFPVLLCSSIGYNNTRDKEGFLDQTKTWNHAMLLAGMDRRRGKREGGLIINSWGADWVTGGLHELGCPAGSFWADAEHIDRAIRQGDSYSFSNLRGFPRRDIDYYLI